VRSKVDALILINIIKDNIIFKSTIKYFLNIVHLQLCNWRKIIRVGSTIDLQFTVILKGLTPRTQKTGFLC
jgi:hypothetical protein